MSYRDEPQTAEAMIADLTERLRRLETTVAAVPTVVMRTDPSATPDGTAKGDLMVWDQTSHSWVLLHHGTNGQKLVSDSTTAVGLKWTT